MKQIGKKSLKAFKGLSLDFELESCKLTADFWMQSGVGGLVIAVLLVLALRLSSAAIKAVSN